MFASLAGLGDALREMPAKGFVSNPLEWLNKVPALINLKQSLLKGRMVRLGVGGSNNDGAAVITIDVAIEGEASSIDDAHSKDAHALLQMLNIIAVDSSSNQDLNKLLEEFTQASGAIIVDRQTCARQRFVKLVVEAAGDDANPTRFRYSPSFHKWNHAANKGAQESALQSTVDEMLSHIYSLLEASNFMMDAALERNLNQSLPNFLLHNIRGQREGFGNAHASALALKYWMHGPPGIGKTEFIRVFASVLQEAIRTRVDPEFTVSVVKVPLNAMSCQTLNHILCIQGLSDWSVERMLEQSLSKGHAVIMHLEEAPPDQALQDDLSACVQRMLKKLFARYPEFVCNVLLIYTSNHEPSLGLGKQCRVCSMEPPMAQQRVWLARKLEQRLGSKVRICDANAYPALSTDIRPLNAWWMSVAYALLHSHQTARFDDGATALVQSHHDPNKLLVGWQAKTGETSALIELTSSDGGYFYTQLDGDKTSTIFSMSQRGFLTPAVIVLQGDAQQLCAAEQALLEQWREHLTAYTHVQLFSQEDECKVLGDAGEVRGGLLRFIDDCTNPNSSSHLRTGGNGKRARAGGEEGVCAVFARVNEIGSFLLRELLEPGDKSRTHRLGVSKKGLLFVVAMERAERITPQLQSRAHQYILL